MLSYIELAKPVKRVASRKVFTQPRHSRGGGNPDLPVTVASGLHLDSLSPSRRRGLAGMTGLLNDFPWTLHSLKELTF